PVYEEFFRTVRATNASLPSSRRLRVLLGDSPVDWDHIHSFDDLYREMGDRDANAVQVLQQEVLAKGRRALVVYGGQHLLRTNSGGIVFQLEKNYSTKVFVVLPQTRRDLTAVQADIVSWPMPSAAFVRGTALGSVAAEARSGETPIRWEDQFD